MAMTSRPLRSRDGGDTWQEVASTELGAPVRRAAHADGLFVVVASSSGAAQIAISDDEGDSWIQPSFPAGCGVAIQTRGGIAFGNDVLLVVGGDGVACRSTDRGASWSTADIGANTGSHLVFDGASFVIWSSNAVHRSADGESWTEEPTSPAVELQATAAIEGRFVAASPDGYEDQALYVSDDGTSWQAVSGFAPGHAIRFITPGVAACE